MGRRIDAVKQVRAERKDNRDRGFSSRPKEPEMTCRHGNRIGSATSPRCGC